ncbi:hypothetical protein [Sphingobium yanoikuyae]|uniref:hypothetical protein n=2 Tax=Sphingomonadaceae TaxID=41297 RepID=UPI00293C4538|nr:hypothetical protein [Sphingobium yanoikuyae]MDV3477837.1 hypothetical protein [Sphingobium yanoikuyae]
MSAVWSPHGQTFETGLATGWTGQAMTDSEAIEQDPFEGIAFGTWLIGQHGRDGWIGDLARAAKADRGFPRHGDPDAVRLHLNKMQAESDMFEAVDDAERLWAPF